MSVNPPFSFFVQWHLTERCNLACTHCYQGKPVGDEMTFPEIRDVIDQTGEMLVSWSAAYGIDFAPSFNITGGEPLLREDLFPVIDASVQRDFAVYLLTNGTLIDRSTAKTLVDLGVKGVQVSLEGPELIHDSIRGRGSFNRSLLGIGYLVDAGMPVTLNVTLSRINSSCVDDLIGLARSLGAQRLGFSRLVPSGRGAGLFGAMLTAGEVRALYEEIFSREVEGLEFVTGDPVASQMGIRQSPATPCDIPTGGCAAGLSGLTLLPDGTVTPCRRLGIPIGNVRRDSLRDMWATSPVLERLRTKGAYIGKCGSCERWSECRGCRAIAYACSLLEGKADYLAEDPQCFIGSGGDADPQ